MNVNLDVDLLEAIAFYKRYWPEADKLVVGNADAKRKAIIAALSEIGTTYSAKKERRVGSGSMKLVGVPGVAKTFLGVVIAAIIDGVFVRIQGRSDMMSSEITGSEVFNLKTNEFESRPGAIALANVVLLDEINRIPPKSQSAFLEPLQDRTITIGKEQTELPEFCFAIATSNPIEVGEGTYAMSAAADDRFTLQVEMGYLPPEEEEKLADFHIKNIELEALLTPERAIELRSVIAQKVKVPKKLLKYIRRLVVATRPKFVSMRQVFDALKILDMKETDDNIRFVKKNYFSSVDSPSDLVQEYVVLGASPRATMSLGPTAKVHALFVRESGVVMPEDVKALAKNVFAHRIYLKPGASKAGITVDDIIEDVLERVVIP